MKIPNAARKKALLIVDVQPAFITKRNKYVIRNIKRLLQCTRYDLYVNALFSAERGSLWDKQTGWICPKDENYHTLKEVASASHGKKIISIEKNKKSVFKGNRDLLKLLKQKKIREVHVIGLDTNDCVLATALESFDLGFFTYVIEECSESSASRTLHKHTLALLRHLNLTNNSCRENVPFLYMRQKKMNRVNIT